MSERTVTVYEVSWTVSDGHPQSHGGNYGDGSFIYRTRNKSQAESFARVHDYQGV